MWNKISVISDRSIIENEILKFMQCNISNESKSCQFKTRLVLSELLANAIIHGNKECMEKRIEILFEIIDRVLYLKIRDESGGFDLVKAEDFLRSHDEEAGRGLAIVREITDELYIDELGSVTIKLDFKKL